MGECAIKYQYTNQHIVLLNEFQITRSLFMLDTYIYNNILHRKQPIMHEILDIEIVEREENKNDSDGYMMQSNTPITCLHLTPRDELPLVIDEACLR